MNLAKLRSTTVILVLFIYWEFGLCYIYISQRYAVIPLLWYNSFFYYSIARRKWHVWDCVFSWWVFSSFL